MPPSVGGLPGRATSASARDPPGPRPLGTSEDGVGLAGTLPRGAPAEVGQAARRGRGTVPGTGRRTKWVDTQAAPLEVTPTALALAILLSVGVGPPFLLSLGLEGGRPVTPPVADVDTRPPSGVAARPLCVAGRPPCPPHVGGHVAGLCRPSGTPPLAYLLCFVASGKR